MDDSKNRQLATGTVMIDNASVRVTEWAFANKGDHTGWHEHMHDYEIGKLNGMLKKANEKADDMDRLTL